jgi:molecular chaperone DnaK (HSP70)
MNIDNKEILVGIDFGTTNTVITHFTNNKANILLDGIFKIIPSKIAKFNDKIYCGNYIPVNTTDVIHSFKISIGDNSFLKFKSDDISYSPHDILVIFFKHLTEIIYNIFQI